MATDALALAHVRAKNTQHGEVILDREKVWEGAGQEGSTPVQAVARDFQSVRFSLFTKQMCSVHSGNRDFYYLFLSVCPSICPGCALSTGLSLSRHASEPLIWRVESIDRLSLSLSSLPLAANAIEGFKQGALFPQSGGGGEKHPTTIGRRLAHPTR